MRSAESLGSGIGGDGLGVVSVLSREVRRARRRWFLRYLLTGATVAACGMVIVGAAVATLLVLRPDDVGLPVAWTVLGIIGVSAIGVAFVVSWWRTPSERAMARQLDDAFLLKSQFVTAVDLEREPPEQGTPRAMHRALLRDLQSVASRVRADGLVPLRFLPLHAMILAALGTSFVAVGMAGRWTSSPSSISSADAANASSWSEAQGQDLVAELDALADALEEEAEEDDESYTRALAEAARSMARELREAPGLDVDEEVRRLLTHVEVALGSHLVPRTARDAAASSRREGDPSDATSGNEPDVPLAPLDLPMPGDAGSTSSLDDVRSVRERLETMQSQRVDNPYGGSFDLGHARTDAKIQEAGILAETAKDAAGAPVGAAQRSTRAPGDAAGAGSQALFEGERAPTSAFEDGDDVALPQAGPDDGARVGIRGDVDASGEAAGSVIGRGTGAGEEGDGPLQGGDVPIVERDSIRRDAGAWRREALDPYARLMAQRLFEPEAPE